MKAVTFFYENTDSNRHFPHDFSCYVDDELFESLYKRNNEQGCLIELENGSQIYLGGDVDKTEPPQHSDFSFIKNEDDLLGIVSYSLALKDYLFEGHNIHNFNHPVESYVNEHFKDLYFNFPVDGTGIIVQNFSATRFDSEILPSQMRNCYKSSEYQHEKNAFIAGYKPENVSKKDIYADYIENIRFFTEYRQKFLNESLEEIFPDQDLSLLFGNIKVPESFNEETLHEIYFSLSDKNKKHVQEDVLDLLHGYSIKLMENFTFNIERNDLDPLNVTPNELVDAAVYVKKLSECYFNLDALLDDKIKDESLNVKFHHNLNLAFDDLSDFGDCEVSVGKHNFDISELSSDLKTHFLELAKEDGLDCSLFQKNEVKKSLSR